MTHVEFHACEAESEVLRDRITEMRKEAKLLKQMLAGTGYVDKRKLAIYHQTLDRIITQ